MVGDIQGCHDALQQLLGRCGFRSQHDRLILLGDLVNRGPQSLQVLQFARALGEHCITLLGNHDLHLLAVAQGLRAPHAQDTLDEVLRSPERDALLGWLRTRQLAHAEAGCLFVHAGVLPQWSVAQTLALAAEVQAALRSDGYASFLARMYGNSPARWSDGLQGADRLRVIVNALTRLRFCSAEGEMEFASKEGTGGAPPGYLPWFEAPGRATAHDRVVFGHWSTLGLVHTPHLVALDTGCVWGGRLSALRLAEPGCDEQLFQTPCPQAQAPGRS